MKYLNPLYNKPNKIKLKKKKKISLDSKIYFGSFLDQNYYYDKAEISNKYDNMKKIISKSKNFSFIKNLKTANFSKIKGINEKLCNSILYTNVSTDKDEQIKAKVFKDKNKKIVNKNDEINKTDKNYHFSPKLLLRNINKDNSFIGSVTSLKTYYNTPKFRISKNINDLYDKNFSNRKILQRKNNSYSNISEIHNIYTNLSKVNKSYSNLNNSYGDRTFYITQKKSFISNLNKSLNKIIKCKTPKKEIRNLSEIINVKCKKKIEKINKIIQKQSIYIPKKNSIINLLSDNENNNTNDNYYSHLKSQVRLVSVVDNLKHVTQNVPMNLIDHLEKDYQIKSKKIIKDNTFTKKISNIYKSFTEGQLINKKINSRNIYINKLASKNILDFVNLKSRYQKFDSLIQKIKEENSKTRNSKLNHY